MTTGFQRKVHDVLRSIPRGKVATYGDVARRLGVTSARAVGQACRANPHAPEVPCHRVVAADGRLGGYGGETSGRKLQEKVRLLRAEGVPVEDGRIVDFPICRHAW